MILERQSEKIKVRCSIFFMLQFEIKLYSFDENSYRFQKAYADEVELLEKRRHHWFVSNSVLSKAFVTLKCSIENIE